MKLLMSILIQFLKKSEKITEFNMELFTMLVDKMVVYNVVV